MYYGFNPLQSCIPNSLRANIANCHHVFTLLPTCTFQVTNSPSHGMTAARKFGAQHAPNKPVCTGSFSFPMQIGNKYAYEKLPWPTGEGYSSANCEVNGQEKVNVSAGSFDAVKIECSGFWNRVFGGTFSGRLKEVYWYAPSISRMVKSEYINYDASGKMDTREVTELTELKAKTK